MAHGVVPPHIYDHIIRTTNDPDLKNRAQSALHDLSNLHSPHQPGQGEGITAGDDDTTYTEQQTPQGQQEIKELEQEDEQADKNDPVDPHDLPGGRKRRQKRQSTEVPKFVYNIHQGCDENPPSMVDRKIGSPIAQDPDVNTVYDSLTVVDNFFRTVFGYNGIDGNGRDFRGTVHYCDKYLNAFWNGAGMFFGDGDGVAFNKFSDYLDVIGHEFGHGIIDAKNPLYYYGQSGAINEHYADVFGIMIKQWNKSQTVDQSDWLVGAGLIPGARALRDFKNPGTAYNTPSAGQDQQPNNYASRYTGRYDNGGVHLNSGFLNRAFYLFATSLGGNSWDKPGRIWFAVLYNNLLTYNTNISSFVTQTLFACSYFYGGKSGTVYPKLLEAWRTVGVPIVEPTS
ncbi:Extracellular metalloprotease [Lachnellula suecica]|uniref:Extracellular metalloprotease n=1 Tax=Lachnellula suecica TaxID=602035 RepID=A0A8T9CG09_9HELO|nr:Extracellular metalloprotease [Lachnellula suecica]